MMPSHWNILRVTSSFSTPPLLAKFEFSEDGHDLLVTDLSNIWCESLDRNEVNERALVEATPIDPSEDTAQFLLLGQKVQDCISGQAGTAVRLEHYHDKNSKLLLESPLPAPLQPLRWPIYMSPAPATRLTGEFILPLLIQHMEQSQRVRSLLACIREKDHVIGKLVDKVDSAGVEVGNVFLSAQGYMSGKKGLSWDQAGKVIKGLAPFDERSWSDQRTLTKHVNYDIVTLLQEATSGGLSSHDEQLRALGSAIPASSWWEKLGDARFSKAGPVRLRIEELGRTGKVPRPAARNESGSMGSETEGEDEFERQRTPSPIKFERRQYLESPNTAGGGEGQQDDGETTEDEDLDQQIRPSKISKIATEDETKSKHGNEPALHGHKSPAAAKASTVRKLGAIGGKHKEVDKASERKDDSSHETLATPGIRYPASQNGHDQRGTSEHGEDSKHRTNMLKAPKAPSRLGKIGGSKAIVTTTKPPLPHREDSPATTEYSQSTLGKFGTKPEPKNRSGTDSPKTQPSTNANIAQCTPTSSEEVPSPEEMADRRREELKRQITQKSHAPAKKARRF